MQLFTGNFGLEFVLQDSLLDANMLNLIKMWLKAGEFLGHSGQFLPPCVTIQSCNGRR